MNCLPGKFVWFEHVSPDVRKASDFYGELFGWSVERMPMGDQTYSMIMNGGAGIGGLRQADAGMRSHWASYVSVEDVDASFAKATAAGAEPVMPPTPFGSVGRGAALLDTTGAALCLWRDAQGDRPDAEKTAYGDWYWNELWTRDAKTALAFYEKVFGYTHDTMSMADKGTYYILQSGGKARAGVFQSDEPNTPPMWLPYVHVADCDASLAKAEALGAKVFMPATDVPEVGRFAAMTDPFGAAIAIIRGMPQASSP
jgi:predicted enzyme related to lactoylglutathione lyase